MIDEHRVSFTIHKWLSACHRKSLRSHVSLTSTQSLCVYQYLNPSLQVSNRLRRFPDVFRISHAICLAKVIFSGFFSLILQLPAYLVCQTITICVFLIFYPHHFSDVCRLYFRNFLSTGGVHCFVIALLNK